ncbi:calcium/sodium antiporter [Candidatus Margulisiibacteriota bacterium]
MIAAILIFILGFVFLVKGADYLIDGATVLAHRFNIPNIVIGLTIVSIGTSAPELVVNIISGLKGHSEIALGNVFGSNIANILLVLGIGVMLRTLQLNYKHIRSDLFFLLASTLLLVRFVFDDQVIAWYEGSIFLVMFIIYLFYSFKIRKDVFTEEEHKIKPFTAIGLFLLGMIMLFLGGRWVVQGVVVFSHMLMLSQALIALTAVALGTSLPELTVTIISIMRNKYEIAIGNAVGSNIFNILWVLGFGAILRPLIFLPKFYLEISLLFISTILLLIFLKWREKITRMQGIIFLGTYFLYLIFIFYRN